MNRNVTLFVFLALPIVGALWLALINGRLIAALISVIVLAVAFFSSRFSIRALLESQNRYDVRNQSQIDLILALLAAIVIIYTSFEIAQGSDSQIKMAITIDFWLIVLLGALQGAVLLKKS